MALTRHEALAASTRSAPEGAEEGPVTIYEDKDVPLQRGRPPKGPKSTGHCGATRPENRFNAVGPRRGRRGT